MKTYYTITLAMFAGAVLGGAAIQSLHAQAKLPAYQVIEVNVKDPELYKQYAEKAMPLQLQYSARFIARGGKVDTFAGELPRRAVIAVYDSIEKVQALRDSPEYKALVPLRDKAVDYHSFIIEGSAN
jgi:uncharacterized protein (DUF1330 family)